VIRQAADKLAELESGERPVPAHTEVPTQADMFGAVSDVEKALRDLNPDDLTPRQAMETLYRLKQLSDG